MKPNKKSHERSNGISWGRLLLWGVVAALMMVGPVSADVYYWRDEKGVLHFSNREKPPSGATLYLPEPPPREPLPVEPEPEPEPEPLEPDASQLEEALEETNRRLDDIVDKLDDVTGRIEQSLWMSQYAVSAASEAQYAAMQAIRQADRCAAEGDDHRSAAVSAGGVGVLIPGDRTDGRIRRGIHQDLGRERFFKRPPVEQGPLPTDFDARFRQPTDFNERFRQPSAFEQQFIRRPPQPSPKGQAFQFSVHGRRIR